MKYAALVAALLALAGTPTQAQDTPTWGDPAFGGTGCPDGTAKVIKGLSVQAAVYLFDEYSVGDNGRAVDRETCGIAIPVTVPAGTQVAVRNVALSGMADLPEGVDGTLNVELFTAGTQGPENAIDLPSGKKTPFVRFVTTPDDQLQWSACGADVNLRVNTSLRSRGDKEGKAELNALIIYPLATRAC